MLTPSKTTSFTNQRTYFEPFFLEFCPSRHRFVYSLLRGWLYVGASVAIVAIRLLWGQPRTTSVYRAKCNAWMERQVWPLHQSFLTNKGQIVNEGCIFFRSLGRSLYGIHAGLAWDTMLYIVASLAEPDPRWKPCFHVPRALPDYIVATKT